MPRSELRGLPGSPAINPNDAYTHVSRAGPFAPEIVKRISASVLGAPSSTSDLLLLVADALRELATHHLLTPTSTDLVAQTMQAAAILQIADYVSDQAPAFAPPLRDQVAA